jgi:hypothetical protein
MKTFVILLFTAFGFVMCRNNSETGPTGDAPVANLFEENAGSKFEILEKKEETGYQYRTVESNFRDAYIQLVKSDEKRYFAHLVTTTEKATGLEGQKRNIKVKIRSFDKPAENVVEIDQDCDDIELQNHTYRTVKYGCCGALNHYEIFDYSNQKIIEGDGSIVTGSLPNSRLILYAGFIQETKDSTTFGTLYYSTTGSGRFSIRIKGNPSSIAACPEIAPEISFVTNNKRDTFDNALNEYTLWSFDQVEKQELITNLSIRFKLECSEGIRFRALNIPIINGKPFGTSDKTREVTLE